MLRLSSRIVVAAVLPAAAMAQDHASGIRDLVFQTRDLSFFIRDIAFSEQAIEGEPISLAIEETETEIRIALPADILFDFDKADIEPEAAEALAQVAKILRDRPGRVRIEGHTDSKGSDTYNKELSEQRASSVRKWLVKYENFDESGLEAAGLGESKPVAPNELEQGADNPDGRRKNRRVEIVITK